MGIVGGETREEQVSEIKNNLKFRRVQKYYICCITLICKVKMDPNNVGNKNKNIDTYHCFSFAE